MAGVALLLVVLATIGDMLNRHRVDLEEILYRLRVRESAARRPAVQPRAAARPD